MCGKFTQFVEEGEPQKIGGVPRKGREQKPRRKGLMSFAMFVGIAILGMLFWHLEIDARFLFFSSTEYLVIL